MNPFSRNSSSISFRAAERNLFQRPSKTIILHKDINPSTFPFYQCRWRRCPPRQRPNEAGRYARPTPDIRLRWHPVCTYLLWNHWQLQVHSFWAALCCHPERQRRMTKRRRLRMTKSGCVYGHKRQASFRTGRLTASNPDLYLIKKIGCCKISLFEVFSRFRYRSVRDNKVKSTYFFD